MVAQVGSSTYFPISCRADKSRAQVPSIPVIIHHKVDVLTSDGVLHTVVEHASFPKLDSILGC